MERAHVDAFFPLLGHELPVYQLCYPSRWSRTDSNLFRSRRAISALHVHAHAYILQELDRLVCTADILFPNMRSARNVLFREAT